MRDLIMEMLDSREIEQTRHVHDVDAYLSTILIYI